MDKLECSAIVGQIVPTEIFLVEWYAGQSRRSRWFGNRKRAEKWCENVHGRIVQTAMLY